jgi:nitrate/nitrite-specific signal transduction histidine kinase
VAASLAGTGGGPMNPQAYDTLRDSMGNGTHLTTIIQPVTIWPDRPAIVISVSYITSSGQFGGLVEGMIYLGSPKLGQPLSSLMTPAKSGQGVPESSSYLVDSDGTILWHSDPQQVGQTMMSLPSGKISGFTPDAVITPLGGEQYIVGYAPLNLQLLFPRASISPNWVYWYVVTQERWADLVAPLNSLLTGLLFLALVTLTFAVLMVARSAGTLTRPVGQLVAAARALSAGQLRHRLPESGPVEIEELARQFNSMAQRLQSSYAELENKVAERTRELASANGELERRLLESVTMQNVAANLAGTAGLDEILKSIASSVTDTLGTESCLIFLPRPSNENELEAALEWNVPRLTVRRNVPVEGSLAGLAYRTGQVQISQDASGDPHLFGPLVDELAAKSVAAAPMVSRGHTIGVVTAINKLSGPFTDDDVRLLTLLSNQAAVAVERARLYSRAQQQLLTLQTVNELSLSVTLSRSMEETLVNAMEHIGKLMGATGAVVFLHDQKEGMLNYAASYNLSPVHQKIVSEAAPMPAVPDKGPRKVAMLEAFLTQKPYIVEDMSDPSYFQPWAAYTAAELGSETVAERAVRQLGSLIALPLSVRDTRLGTITVYFAESRQFSDLDIQLFESFAKILALAVYNNQLLAQSNKLATVEERARLARELHDSVTQSLFSLNLTLRAARRVLKADPDQAVNLMDNVQELAQGSLAEMRALIFELRPQALENEGLGSALQKHADAVRARNGLIVNLEIEGDRRLPIEHEEALYQIAREALHNVVKHAQATEAWVCLDMRSDDVTLSVRDNGRGFDPTKLTQAGGSHIGTSTMRERAEAIHGTLTITTSPGGTEVLARVHLPAEQDIQEQEEEGAPAQTVPASRL